MTTDHETFRELLALRLYGELEPDESARLARHLTDCAACREEAGALERGLGSRIPSSAVEPATELPEDLARRTAALAGTVYSEADAGLGSGPETWIAALVGFAAGAVFALGLRPDGASGRPVPPAPRPIVQTTWSTAPVEEPADAARFERSDPPPPAPASGTLARLGTLLDR